MSTPTEAHLDLALKIAEAISRSGNVAAARLIADSEAKAVAAKVSSLTCTHHNDAMRAACPVCLVAALTAERDQLHDELTAERARLDWVFHNCKVTADGYPVHDREDLGVAMKEET